MSRRDAARLVAINALVSLALLVAGACWMQAAQRPAMATLDVAELYRLEEAHATAALVNHKASDAERGAAVAHAATFGAEMTALIEALPAECRCVILSRGAVVGSRHPVPDLTADARRRLGL